MKNIDGSQTVEQNSTSKCWVGQFHEPVSLDHEFGRDAWPLHTTEAGVFSIDPERFIRRIGEIGAKHSAFMTKVAGFDRFEVPIKAVDGSSPKIEYIEVTLLEKTKALMALHRALVDAINDCQGEFKQPAFIGDDYTPHITNNNSDLYDRLRVGSLVPFTELSVVDLARDGDRNRRRVIYQTNLA